MVQRILRESNNASKPRVEKTPEEKSGRQGRQGRQRYNALGDKYIYIYINSGDVHSLQGC